MMPPSALQIVGSTVRCLFEKHEYFPVLNTLTLLDFFAEKQATTKLLIIHEINSLMAQLCHEISQFFGDHLFEFS